MAAAKPARQPQVSVQRGFTVKEVGFTVKEQSLQSPPQLPPLHGQPHGLKDFSSPAADDLLRRSSSAGAHPVTPHQHELERQQLTPNRSGKHHQGRGHGHRSRHQTDSPTRLRSHDSATSTTDDAFGIKRLVSICTSGSFSPTNHGALGTAGPEPHLEVVGTVHASPDVRRLVRAVARGLRCCQEPQAAEAGLGGTYFFRSEAGAMVAIIKPCDEEPLAPNNPKGFVGRELGQPGLKPTVRVGEAALREVAAFLLDHDGFAKVPPTVLVRCFHPIFHTAAGAPVPGSVGSLRRSTDAEVDGAPSGATEQPAGKLGSLQEFVAHDGDTSEVGASRFAAADVRRIGILDIRLFNTDRHAGNMLVVRPRNSGSRHGSTVALGNGVGLARLAETRCALRPIDHGFCLPEALEPPYLEWLHWPQAMMPFDAEELAYIAALDARADCEMLARELPALRPECGRILQVSTALLQAGAAAGLSLSEIGNAMSRPIVGMEEEPSSLERLCMKARAAVDAATHPERPPLLDGFIGVVGNGAADSSGSSAEEDDLLLSSDTESDAESDAGSKASWTSGSIADNEAGPFPMRLDSLQERSDSIGNGGPSLGLPPATRLRPPLTQSNSIALSDVSEDDDGGALPPLPAEWMQEAEEQDAREAAAAAAAMPSRADAPSPLPPAVFTQQPASLAALRHTGKAMHVSSNGLSTSSASGLPVFGTAAPPKLPASSPSSRSCNDVQAAAAVTGLAGRFATWSMRSSASLGDSDCTLTPLASGLPEALKAAPGRTSTGSLGGLSRAFSASGNSLSHALDDPPSNTADDDSPTRARRQTIPEMLPLHLPAGHKLSPRTPTALAVSTRRTDAFEPSSPSPDAPASPHTTAAKPALEGAAREAIGLPQPSGSARSSGLWSDLNDEIMSEEPMHLPKSFQRLGHVRTKYGGAYCPYGGAPPGAESLELGATFGGRHLDSSGTDSNSGSLAASVATSGQYSPFTPFGTHSGRTAYGTGDHFGGHTFNAGTMGGHKRRPGSAAVGGMYGVSLALPPQHMHRAVECGAGAENGAPTRHRRHHGHHKSKRRHAAAYPPPIEGRAPTAVNALFSGLDEAQWEAFMAHLQGSIAAELRSGAWRADKREQPGGVAAASCPRF
mmetsp:Transcript_15386/g.46445  ORF Transcript_15386/g.46445 Transcript_15386/m.46445 type:complete len:1132 (+) Transcript_15386:545-3940(+)